MICFSSVCDTVDDLRNIIKSDRYNQSIERYLLTLLRDKDLKGDPAEYFSLQVEVRDVEQILNIENDSYYKKSELELELSELFANKIRTIRNSISDEYVFNTFKDYINANRLFLDIERFGFPEIIMLRGGAQIFAKVDTIEKDDFDIVLSSNNLKLKISHLADSLKPCSPSFIVVGDYNLCYGIYSDFDYSGVQLYWR